MKVNLKPIAHGLALAFGGVSALAVSYPVVAQQQQLERVEITGSLLRRVDAETALPVTILDNDELVKQGVTTAEKAVQFITANQANNFGTSGAIGQTTGAKAEADLRGLSAASGTNANKTLVLLNGRRIANHSFDAAAVDLNAIPMAAVSRIEVLRDGASAIYGTDAIAGVINFILRRDYQGLEASYENQTPQQSGGGDMNRVNLTGGFGSLAKDRFNVMGTFDWRKQKVLAAAERSFASTGVVGPTRDDLVSGTSGTSFPGDLNGFEPSAPNCNPPSSLADTDPDTGVISCRYDFTRDIDIIPENEQITALVRGSLAIGEHTATIEYLYANNQATSRVAPTPNSYLMPTTSPYFPAGALPVATLVPDALNPGNIDETSPCGFQNCVQGGVANWRQVPGGKRTSGDDSTTTRLMATLEGLVAGWDYKAAIGQSENKSTASVSGGYLNDEIMQEGIWTGVINPFGDQTPQGTAAIGSAVVYADTLIGKYTVSFVDARATKDIMQLSAGPLAMAFGAEYRKEKESLTATDINAVLINSLGIDPDSDTYGDRNVWAVFAEIGIPILKNLDATVALRYDDYSDFGSTTNPKFGLRYQPVKQLLLRGSYNSGFRAPTLYEIYQPPSLTTTSDSYDDPLLCPGGTAVPGATRGVVCGQQVLTQQGGPGGLGLPADTLQPEESDSWTVGFVFEPMPSMTFGLDYWNIHLKNQISPLPEQAIFGDPTKYADRYVRCSQLAPADRANIDVCLNYPNFDPIAYIRQPTENLGDLKTSGIDMAFAWRSAATSYGRWGFSMDGTYVMKYDYQREKNGQEFDAVGRYSDNAPVFRWQHVATVSWTMGPWSALFSNRYKTGYEDQGGASDVDSYSVFDLTGTWTGVKGLTINAGVLNLFDEDPPRTVQVTTFQRGYDPRFTDPRGRTWLFRIAYKFL